MAKNTTTQSLSGGCLGIFGLPFLCAGLLLSGFYFHGYIKWWQARSWEEVPCWIESVDLKHGDNTSRTIATYRYVFAGHTHHGDKVSFHGGSDNIGDFQDHAYREISRYAPPKPTKAECETIANNPQSFRCFVNPKKPEEAVLYRGLRWEMQAFMAIFALTFPAIGAALVVGAYRRIRSMRQESALAVRFPMEPWRWKTAWTGTTIPEYSNPLQLAVFPYTLWSGLVIIPLIISTAMCGMFHRGSSAWLLMFFILLWMIPLWLSIKRLRLHMAIGEARFEPNEWPTSPGGTLCGAILLGKPLPACDHVEVFLSCEKIITQSSGDSSSTTTEKIWSHREMLSQNRILRDLNGIRLPVEFSLPTDAPESGAYDDTNHVWKLELKIPGKPIAVAFEIPVFRTAKLLRTEKTARNVPSILDDAAVDLPALLSARGIMAQFDSAGMPVTIDCHAARMRSQIISLIIFDVIWTGVAIFLLVHPAPLIFRIVWPASAALIWCIVLWNLLHKRSTTFDANGVTIRNQLGPIIWTQAFEKSDIIGFSHDSNMTSNNTRFYRVRLESVLRKKKTIVSGITENTTAAALVKRFDAWKKFTQS